ncbi:MAG TPA: SLC13 family permease, partial [Thermoanaerobaculia bacterium]|nr:SLC13 family permease [Thermoanaerobaculia bacterium]
GFSNEIIIILGSIFVLSGALMRTGVLDYVGGAIHRVAGGSRSKILALVMSATAGVSGFMNNTTTTAIFMPAVIGLCRRSRLSPSKVLIPLAFASMLGGTCTLVGTSTNVAASGYLQSIGLPAITLFEFLPVGLTMVFLGILYMVVAGHLLLPDSREGSYTEDYAVREYLTELVVPAGSPFVGQPVRNLPDSGTGLTVLAVHRGENRLYPEADTVLAAGDLLLAKARREALLRVKETPGIEIKPDLKLGDEDLIGDTLTIAEAILMPQSALLGRTIKELDFRRRFGMTVIAIYRRGHAVATKIGGLPLRIGDVLLLQGRKERFRDLAENADLWVLQEHEHRSGRPRKGLYALGIFAAAVVASGLDLMPLPIAFLLAALAVVAMRLITMEEAYNFIDWRLLILIAGMTAFGTAMQTTGAAEYLAGLIVDWCAPFGILAIMAGFSVLTILLTQPMSNAAAALVVLPVAVSAAQRLGVDPRAFAILITLSASLSFVTPFEPSCLIVYGPGKYRFRDFLMSGAPLTAIAVVVLLLMVPVIWPLR